MEPSLEKILFAAAEGFSRPEDRQRFLEFVAKADPRTGKELEDLLGLQASAETFFDLQPDIPPEAAAPRDGDEKTGGSIGRYRLIERIGEGGCGVVYLAEQQEPVRRKVALKIIRLGMDTEKVIARFQTERQSLAMMDHPHIARVLDAGATGSGRPYFVMELVDGEWITDFCNAHTLDLNQRLQLFVKVCQAIQHAHQKGVIHRDIKPSNVLVRLHDGVPEPKVIDFGTARAITRSAQDADVTVMDQFVGTPAYMSPEQAAGGTDIDTRSDIYSLGTLLYELVSGRPPFDLKRFAQSGIDEVRRVLREEDPPPLSGLSGRDQAGDLDWIVMKAMAKERTRRYDTANGLAVDVQRVLNDEPVSARPPSRSYRLKKLISRNKVVFAVGSVAVIALLAGLGVSTRLFIREKAAREEQSRLSREAEQARRVEQGLKEVAEAREQVAKAAVQIARGNMEGADALLAAIPMDRIPTSLEAADSFRKVADWHLASGRWGPGADRLAAAVYSHTSVDDADDNSVSFQILPTASTLCTTNKDQEYERFRQFTIKRFSSTKNPQVAEQLLKATLLKPANESTLRSLDGMADFVKGAVNDPGSWIANSPYLGGWSCFVLGLRSYRDGDLAESREWLERSLTYPVNNPPKDVSARLILAMIDSHEGRKADAIQAIQSAREPIDRIMSAPLPTGDSNTGFWFDWINAKLLLDESLKAVAP